MPLPLKTLFLLSFGRVGLFLKRFLSHSLDDMLLQAPFLLCCNWLVGWTCYWIHYWVYYTSNAYKWVFFFRLLMLRPSSGRLYCSKWSEYWYISMYWYLDPVFLPLAFYNCICQQKLLILGTFQNWVPEKV